ncbi:6-phosphogluconate dehydrogenase [Sarcoptes scabiei]|nr:6-phosphogluconate dehydrogenase [Sarcoptes scabiei]
MMPNKNSKNYNQVCHQNFSNRVLNCSHLASNCLNASTKIMIDCHKDDQLIPRKRKSTLTNGFKSFQKKRHKNKIMPPTKFLLGGNIHDPLNLKSFETEDQINDGFDDDDAKQNPVDHKETVDVLIPSNMHDPLNLAHSESLNNSASSISNLSLYKRRKRTRTSSESEIQDNVTFFDKQIIKDDLYLTHQKQTSSEALKNLKKFKRNHKRQSSFSDQCSIERLNKEQSHRDICTSLATTILEKTSSLPSSSGVSITTQENVSNRSDKNSSSHLTKHQKKAFQYGNYNRYYGYRKFDDDPRINLLRKEFFENRDVLDIGCNVGHITILIAKDFSPNKIVGIDIDSELIRIAQKNMKTHLSSSIIQGQTFPLSLPIMYSRLNMISPSQKFPNNIYFVDLNYVPESDDSLQLQRPEYDTILCLSVTKWIHLNWGDLGVKRLFQRVFLQLRPGGLFILEPQSWSSYRKKSKMTPETNQNYSSIRFRPECFHQYLLKEIGFKTCELLGTPKHDSKGFK